MKTLKTVTKASLFLSLCLVTVTYCIHKRSNKDRTSFINIAKAQRTELKTWKDSAQKWHAIAQVAEVKNTDFMKVMLQTSAQTNHMANEFTTIKKSFKNLEYLGVTEIASNYNSTKNTVFDTVFIDKSDTAKASIISYSDSAGWYSYRALVSNNNIKNIQIYTKDSISTAVTWRRKWFLGRKHYQQEIISHNPHSEISYSKSIIIKK